ncbi:MAG: PilZ domain-containing protein [Sphingomonas sp.]|nr:PilZ domain-containing protein [Sphingomonas sp.]
MDQFAHDPFKMAAADEAASQRHEVRDSLFLVAQFRLAGSRQSEQVRIRNLSAGGLMAEVSSPIAQGTEVELDVRGVGWISGKIAWYAAGRVGVAFDQMIDPILARKPIGGGTQTPVYVKPILPILPTR